MKHLLPGALGVLRKQRGLGFHFLDEFCPKAARVGPGVDSWLQAKRRSKRIPSAVTLGTEERSRTRP